MASNRFPIQPPMTRFARHCQGDLLTGVVNSIGKRRDAKASRALVKMILGADADLVRAGAAALGSIGGVSSAKELRSTLRKIGGMTKISVADASLVCAERLLAEGKSTEALDLHTFPSAPDVPKAMRMAAMSGIIRQETAIDRLR
jgi:hypothetical protein